MKSISEIRINFLGMSNSYQVVTTTKDFIPLKLALEENTLNRIFIKQASLQEVKKESADFMNNTFKLHNLLHTSSEEINEALEKRIINSEEDSLEVFNSLGYEIEPYSLPIVLVDENWEYGAISTPIIHLKDKSILFREKTMHSHIILSRQITNFTGKFITHEITHSQIDSNKRVVKYYQNYEAIPIFVELIHKFLVDDENMTNASLMLRLNSLLEKIIYFEKKSSKETTESDIEQSVYLISTLKALNLYEIFINSPSTKKQAIINQIQNIFDGKITVEELLEKENISMEKGIESAKRLVYTK